MTNSSQRDKSSSQNLVTNPTNRYVIAQREPWNLPENEIELPGPSQAPGQPPAINLLTTLIPPILMAIGMGVTVVTKTAKAITIIPMLLMAIGFPAANLIALQGQKKKYNQSLKERESKYRAVLDDQRNQLSALLREQRGTLEREYPAVEDVARIALNHTKRLWWRRPMDSDFLSLRIGTGQGQASFTVKPPRYADPNDPLSGLSLGMLDEFKTVPSMPILLNLAKTGSVAVAARNSQSAYDLTCRLILDVIVHHSPQDVQVAVLANTRDAERHWSWLKWAPHTAALNEEEKPRRLNFSEGSIDEYLKWLGEEFNARSRQSMNSLVPSKHKPGRASLVVILDDTGIARQVPEICQIAESGFEVGIHLIFVGGQNWPRECRARIDLSGTNDFQYVETWDAGSKGIRKEGKSESAPVDLAERVSRSIAGLEVVGGVPNTQLPDSIRISSVLGPASLEIDSIKRSWSANFRPDELLQFPIGVYTNRDQLDQLSINLLPENLDGIAAYHTILIGTTGSGKSEFMKSLVMGAALKYPPNLLNFFFLDFKGGMAFNIFKDLPHVLGVVTNLNAELVKRGIESTQNELKRRTELCSKSQVANIWDYNQMHRDAPLNHLVLILDEFTKGLNEFPELKPALDLLVRQGRSMGMYLILANQEVNSEVDKLFDNVGWFIALKVGKPEQIAMIDRSLVNENNKLPKRAGEGYLRSIKGNIVRFQAGFAGLPVAANDTPDRDEFTIYTVESNGAFSSPFKNLHTTSLDDQVDRGPVITEEALIVSNIKQATRELNITPVARIYLDPLAESLDLNEIIEDSAVKPKFIDGEWVSDTVTTGSFIAPVGYVDYPSVCRQEILEIDFKQQDGHLWIAGAPGSGKAMTLSSLILSLALTHTPEEVQFYVLEFGSGSLRQLEGLPHVGSVIRLAEKEKIQRLLGFLDSELERRTAHETMAEGRFSTRPELFVAINNYAEFRSTYPDEAERVSRYIRDGKAAGIHLIITTNRGADLNRNIASNISRRLVLQLASRDEYTDLVGRIINPLNVRAEGRGYWMDEFPFECQIGNPKSMDIKTLAKEMDNTWTGSHPRIIGTIPSCVSLAELSTQIGEKKKPSPTQLPVGVAYENLELVQADLARELTQWLILGPRESGKSNFLACTAQSLITRSDQWDITAIALKKSLLSGVKDGGESFRFANSAEKATEAIKELAAKLEATAESSNKRFMLIIDDLSSIFEPGMEPLVTAVNSIIPSLSTRCDVHLMASGLLDELRSQMASPIIKLLRQSRTGMVFSKDTGELDWLGASIPLEYRKLDMPTGRGFFVSKGKQTLLQTPSLGECKGRHSDE
mgnify:FL=1